MSKYIIKNCDCILSSGRCNVKSLVYCQDCNDCILKQIVELCKHYKKYSDCGRDCPSFGSFLNKSLSKLDIQEVE